MISVDEAQTQAAGRLVASGGQSDKRPFFTVAIPHYRHTEHLKLAVESVLSQTTDDVELLISDDCSPEPVDKALLERLARSNRSFRYYRQEENLGYDGNVRFCLRLSRGAYSFLLGNDDALYEDSTLEMVKEVLYENGLASVVVGNYADWDDRSAVVRRVRRTGFVGAGPYTAGNVFRTFSFVSGLLFHRDTAVLHETDKWDGSIYYQIYLGCRIVASRGSLSVIDLPLVAKDIKVAGEKVPTYESRARKARWSFERRHLGLDSVIRVTADAILPVIPEERRRPILRSVIRRLIMTTYPFWLFEYRRVANWSYAVGVAREMLPGRLLEEYELTSVDRTKLGIVFWTVTVAGLLLPQALFFSFKERLAALWRVN